MKKFIVLLMCLFAITTLTAQHTDAELTTSANVIRNEITTGGNTKTRIANMFQAIIDSKPSLLGAYTNPSWIASIAWGKIASTPTTISGYGITDAVATSRTITVNGESHNLSSNATFTVDAADVGLGNVDNTSDANKAVSTATQAALDLKANLYPGITQKTSDYTIVLTDAGKTLHANTTDPTTLTITIPADESVAFPIDTRITIVPIGTGSVTVTQAGGVIINSSSTGLTSYARYGPMQLVKISTNNWIVYNGSPPLAATAYTLTTGNMVGISSIASQSVSYFLQGKRVNFVVSTNVAKSGTSSIDFLLPWTFAKSIYYPYKVTLNTGGSPTHSIAMCVGTAGTSTLTCYSSTALATFTASQSHTLSMSITFEIQ